ALLLATDHAGAALLGRSAAALAATAGAALSDVAVLLARTAELLILAVLLAGAVTAPEACLLVAPAQLVAAGPVLLAGSECVGGLGAGRGGCRVLSGDGLTRRGAGGYRGGLVDGCAGAGEHAGCNQLANSCPP